jgi:hypothetical protein
MIDDVRSMMRLRIFGPLLHYDHWTEVQIENYYHMCASRTHNSLMIARGFLPLRARLDGRLVVDHMQECTFFGLVVLRSRCKFFKQDDNIMHRSV